MKIDLGAGTVSPEGFVPRGNVNGTTVYPLPYDDGAAEIIRASHVLEHFPHAEIADVLKEWVRVLKPGGELRIAVPDFRLIAENYLAGAHIPTEGYVMGGQVDGADFHKALFDTEHLKAAMAAAGLVLLRPWKSELPNDCAALPVSLNIAGTKPAQPQPKIRAVMTTPRLGFNDMWNSAITSLPRLGIDFTNVTGAFWDQSLTLAMDRVLEDGSADYLLALDYDSVFNAGHVSKLIQLAMVHPEADAIAPVQSSRHGDKPLFGLSADTRTVSENGKNVEVDRADFEVDLVKVRQAHFGLTLIKVSALQVLSRPWFLGTPNADGDWKDGKLDPDIHFWRAWEKEGKSLFLAPRVVIGHLELMVRWPDENMDPVWQSAKDWSAANSAPSTVWTGIPE
jgi:SAM-dependent methyltransferase